MRHWHEPRQVVYETRGRRLRLEARSPAHEHVSGALMIVALMASGVLTAAAVLVAQ